MVGGYGKGGVHAVLERLDDCPSFFEPRLGGHIARVQGMPKFQTTHALILAPFRQLETVSPAVPKAAVRPSFVL